MSRNIKILLIFGAFAFGFMSPSLPLNHIAPYSLNGQDSATKDSSVRADSLMMDSLQLDIVQDSILNLDSLSSDSSILKTQDTLEVIYGTASYYHNMFVGRPTATGDIFNQSKMTCAHRTIPLKSWVRVTNLNTGKSVILYVNDRMGKSPHEIDLTTAAAKKLGYIRSGWVKVKIEVLPEKP
ncbi:septal ring lytic transglycosylase RlpA family protein [Bacteroidia bacterium]|jgi:rare lipoprotein A|nr:septal ring lytic transglycosylase RlpA family protein [Bacteroidia bacterium]